ncbi:MAG: sulfurtransferase [Chloroflexi bacterium]|nr:MAG: sulfurtransferase [Chloroflexota bacterium]
MTYVRSPQRKWRPPIVIGAGVSLDTSAVGRTTRDERGGVFTPRIIAAAMAAQTDFAHPELLAETDWLAERLDEPSIRIVDCDEFPAYQRLHIKGAVGLRVHHYLKGEDDVHLTDPDQFAKTMSRHGIGSEHTVVAYDGMGGLYAARLWWALDHYGHTSAKVLNGGFQKWFEEGRPVTAEQPHVERARFDVSAGGDRLCGIDEVREAIGRVDTVIWDVRSRAEHTGEDRRQNKHGGHIPGAVHLEWLDLTQPPARSGLLLAPQEMRAKLAAAGITPEKQVLVH